MNKKQRNRWQALKIGQMAWIGVVPLCVAGQVSEVAVLQCVARVSKMKLEHDNTRVLFWERNVDPLLESTYKKIRKKLQWDSDTATRNGIQKVKVSWSSRKAKKPNKQATQLQKHSEKKREKNNTKTGQQPGQRVGTTVFGSPSRGPMGGW